MPSVLRVGGFTFRIYPNDHTPAHVHVQRAECEARVTLETVEVKTNVGFKSSEISRIIDIVKDHQEMLLQVWDTYHPYR